MANESQEREENWVALLYACYYVLCISRQGEKLRDGFGKCTVTKRGAAPASRASARFSPRYAKALQVSQLQMDPEVLKREWLVNHATVTRGQIRVRLSGHWLQAVGKDL